MAHIGTANNGLEVDLVLENNLRMLVYEIPAGCPMKTLRL
jgi:hypothetical protein